MTNGKKHYQTHKFKVKAMKNIKRIGFILVLFTIYSNIIYAQNNRRFKTALTALKENSSNYILVAAHRGDWRETPENSLQSLLNSIKMGADIFECDLAETKDGRIVLMHDKTIDRTMTGKGKPEDYTLKELKAMFLKAGQGHKTQHKIPTLDQILDSAKNKILIDIDKGYPYLQKVLPMLQKRNMVNQVLYNVKDNTPLRDILEANPDIPSELFLVVVVNMEKPNAKEVIESYKERPNTIIQTIFKQDTLAILKTIPEIRKNNSVWMNALWPDHNGGHDDDRAVEKNSPKEAWGWLFENGANIIQTDRPRNLIEYLDKIGKHSIKK